FVLPPDQIAEELVRMARHDYIRESSKSRLPERDLLRLFGLVQAKYDIDFTTYKPTTVERRIRRRMAPRQQATLDDYLRVIHDDPHEIERLCADILIKVTGFFRDPEVFSVLKKDVLPDLFRGRGNGSSNGEGVRAWVPGCATGEEVYSLAIT